MVPRSTHTRTRSCWRTELRSQRAALQPDIARAAAGSAGGDAQIAEHLSASRSAAAPTRDSRWMMLEDKDDDWPPAARHLADRPLAARPLAAQSLAVRPHGVDEAEPGTKALKGAARVRVRPTPDAPDSTRGANDCTGDGRAAPAEHGTACSVPPRAPQHPERLSPLSGPATPDRTTTQNGMTNRRPMA